MIKLRYCLPLLLFLAAAPLALIAESPSEPSLTAEKIIDKALEQERALAKMPPSKAQPRGRYRPDDHLLAFLKTL